MDWLQTVNWPPIFMGLLTLAMVIVIVQDTVSYLITNTMNLFLLGLYPFAVFLLGIHGWPMALVAAGIVLVIGLGIFALGLMGGGDIKLLVVLTLWVGWGMPALQFIFMTAIFGGALVVIVLLARLLLAPLWRSVRRTENLPRILTRKQPVPYGIAIAAAFLLMVWTQQVPALHQ